ncbi:MAG: DUF6093 family protein [Propionibacterium sp.]|nr:DUF6093 family protein [Propionibacterium sp.]
MILPVIGQVSHAAFIPGATPSWAVAVLVDCHGWLPGSPSTVPTESVGELPAVTRLQVIVPAGTVCGHRDRWTIAGETLEQVGGPEDFGHGPFGMSTPLLVSVQSPAESLLTDSCQLQSPTGAAMDPVTGMVTTTWTAYWSGACRLQSAGTQQQTAAVAGDQVTVADLVLSLPTTAPAPSVGHRAVLGSLVLYVTGVSVGTGQVLQQVSVSREVVADRG